MNSGATAERVYEALKKRIMGHEFRPGDRLDPAVLAAPLASSVTPVRDALHVLTGEGLVDTRTSGGFHLPALDEPGLKDLYGWSAELLSLALRGWPRSVDASGIQAQAPEHATVADMTAGLFLAIGRRSLNREHARAIVRLNGRLHAVRIVERHVIESAEREVTEIASKFARGERDALRRLSASYHGRRRRMAADIVRAAYRIGQW